MNKSNAVLIIAEAGVNHNGVLENAFKLVDLAVKAQADVIKFQTFDAAKLVTNYAQKADYQVNNTQSNDSQLKMLQALELSEKDHHSIKAYCDRKNIEFLSTAFDLESLDFLVESLHIKRIKIPSGELNNPPYLYLAASKGLPLILSTGMSELAEIDLALDFIAWGLLGYKNPSLKKVQNCRLSPEAQRVLREKLTILHCISDYPALDKELNLKVINALQSRYSLNIGYSDHSLGILAPIVAVSLGATVIEKHITLDRQMPGPDHLASIEGDELNEMVKSIRLTTLMLGKEAKNLSQKVLNTKLVASKFIVATKHISIGETFSSANIDTKRTGKAGMRPELFWDILDRKASRNYEIDDIIEEFIHD